MSEHRFLLITGLFLWAILAYSAYYESEMLLYIFAGYLMFEGLTNLRLTKLLKYFNKKTDTPEASPEKTGNSSPLRKIEADRVSRIIIATLVYVSFALLPDLLWFMPWFIAGILIMAGITNICPMQIFLKWTGMK
jgi:Inner membrane protein YgaP-like, transmembrane domain